MFAPKKKARILRKVPELIFGHLSFSALEVLGRSSYVKKTGPKTNQDADRRATPHGVTGRHKEKNNGTGTSAKRLPSSPEAPRASVPPSLGSSRRGGANVVVSDVDKDAAQKMVDAIAADGGKAAAHAGDVSDPKVAEETVAFAKSTFGALHLAVNNAGIGGPAALVGEYPIDGWQKVIDVNLNGVFYGLRYQLPAIVEAGGGAIVNMASILGSVGFAQSAAYVAAKHAVVGLTKNAALEYAKQNVRVNSVGPGFIATPAARQEP